MFTTLRDHHFDTGKLSPWHDYHHARPYSSGAPFYTSLCGRAHDNDADELNLVDLRGRVQKSGCGSKLDTMFKCDEHLGCSRQLSCDSGYSYMQFIHMHVVSMVQSIQAIQSLRLSCLSVCPHQL